MKKSVVILLAFFLAGTAGTWVFITMGNIFSLPAPTSEAMIQATLQESSSSSISSSGNDELLMPFGSDLNAAAHTKRIEYANYRTGVIGGNKVLLFFSSSDAVSREYDKQLTSLYFNGTAMMPTYRVDFDTATALGEKYGALESNTFVLLDESGSILKSAVSPSADVLKGLLQ